MTSTTQINRTIGRFQSETDLIIRTPISRLSSLIVWCSFALLSTMVIALIFTQVDKVIKSAGGKIISSDNLIEVEALNPSIIKTIDVEAGQTVGKGQVLATLDSALTSADLKQMKSQVEGLKAEIARAEAQYTQRPFDPAIDRTSEQASYLALEKSHFDEMKALYASSVASFDAKIHQSDVAMDQSKNDEVEYSKRVDIARKHEDMESTLVKSGSESLLNLLAATDVRLEIERTLAFSHGTSLESLHQHQSALADRDSYISNWYATIAQEIVTARNTLDTAQAQLEKASQNQVLVKLAAPEAGRVLSIDPVSAGSVLKQGDEVMTIVPATASVVAEVDIASSDVGYVRTGDKVRLKVDALNASEHGYADGTVTWISAEAFTADANRKPVAAYYKSQVAIEAYHFTDVPPNFRLLPGMTLAADINVGSRSAARYILGGTLRGGDGEMMR